MKYLQDLTGHQLFLIKAMLKSDEWKIYNEYIKNLVVAYLNTSESKDFLRGIRFAISKFEEDIERT